ncbi:MAG: HAMP domain-containing protein [Deltaproteobacteria bacterium]|nr:HAMP domain-containing protein [Deltaproteobacteria bacterium]
MSRFKIFSPTLSLRSSMLIYVVTPLIGAFGLSGYLALNSFEKEVETRMQNDLELVARAIQLPLSYALEKDRVGSMMLALESAFSIKRVYSAYVYDKEGAEIATLGLDDPDPKPERLTELAADGKRRGEYGRIAGREVYSYFVPLTDTGGQINGLLQLTRKGADFGEHLRSIRIKGALSLVLLLLILSGVVLYGHHRALGLQLRRLASIMSRVAQGEREHRFEYGGPKEIVDLGASFNHMLNSIQQAEQELAEHRRTQDKLQKELRQSEKLAALGRFAAGTAHELGSPLSVINGKAQRSLRDQKLIPEHRQTLKTIRKQVFRMEHIIRQLLDFTRSSPIRYSAALPSRLAASAAAAVAEETEANRATLKLSGPKDTTPIMVDPMRVEQALINLLRNAIQCAQRGDIRLSWQQGEEWILFCVEDNGPGVPVDIRSEIFEPFYTTKQVGEGTGLGLSVVHAVAEEHGGRVEVNDSRMGGACFRFMLPARLAENG